MSVGNQGILSGLVSDENLSTLYEDSLGIGFEAMGKSLTISGNAVTGTGMSRR